MKVLEWILFVVVFAVIVSVISGLDLMRFVSSTRHFLSEYGVLLDSRLGGADSGESSVLRATRKLMGIGPLTRQAKLWLSEPTHCQNQQETQETLGCFALYR